MKAPRLRFPWPRWAIKLFRSLRDAESVDSWERWRLKTRADHADELEEIFQSKRKDSVAAAKALSRYAYPEQWTMDELERWAAVGLEAKPYRKGPI